CPKYLATSLTWPRLFLACFESTGMDGQVGARTLVGDVGSYKLTPFVQGQVTPDPLTHHVSEAGSLHLPEPNGLVMTARRQALAIRAERHREDRASVATQDNGRHLRLAQIPEPCHATEAPRSQPLIIGAKGDSINGHPISR